MQIWMENLQVWYKINVNFTMHIQIITYVLQVFWKLLLVSRSIHSKVQIFRTVVISKGSNLIPWKLWMFDNYLFHSCIITSIVHIFMFYYKKFILMKFLSVSMYDSVGGTHHESREKLKSSMSTTTTSEKSKQTSKGKSSHSTGGSENSPKRVQSGSVL